MKTTILDDLELSPEARSALSREALRRGKPVSVLLRDFLLSKAEAVVAASDGRRPVPGNGGPSPEMAA